MAARSDAGGYLSMLLKNPSIFSLESNGGWPIFVSTCRVLWSFAARARSSTLAYAVAMLFGKYAEQNRVVTVLPAYPSRSRYRSDERPLCE
jgi:hypothetical protein